MHQLCDCPAGFNGSSCQYGEYTSYLSFELRLYLILIALGECQLACVMNFNRLCSISVMITLKRKAVFLPSYDTYVCTFLCTSNPCIRIYVVHPKGFSLSLLHPLDFSVSSFCLTHFVPQHFHCFHIEQPPGASVEHNHSKVTAGLIGQSNPFPNTVGSVFPYGTSVKVSVRIQFWRRVWLLCEVTVI